MAGPTDSSDEATSPPTFVPNFFRGRFARDVFRASVATAGGAGISVAAYLLLAEQAKEARKVIPHRTDKAPSRDGIYQPAQTKVERPSSRVAPADIHLMVFGDSTAAGLGCDDAEGTPGVQIVRGIVRDTGKRVQLSTKAIVGATSKGLSSQVDAMLVAGQRPDVAVILIGANDVTKINGIEPSARRLGMAVRRLRAANAQVVVGTCPDLGVVQAIPQPLRSVMRGYGLQLASRQKAHVVAAGGRAVPLADLLAPEFLSSPETMISGDHFHPSAAGYELAATLLLPEVLSAVGEWNGPLPEPPEESNSAESQRLQVWINKLLRARQVQPHPDAPEETD